MPTVFLTNASTSPWTRPGDWSDAGHTVELVGAGGSGGTGNAGVTYRGGAGGGGGGYAKLTYVSGTNFASVPFDVQINNTSTSDGTAAATKWQSTTYASCWAATAGQAGTSPTTYIGGAGGDGALVGTPGGPSYTLTSFVGGAGGGSSSGQNAGSGGGGAAGPNGVGGTGGSVNAYFRGGGGGGGTNGGAGGFTNASTPAVVDGGAGGNNRLGSGGGAGSATGSGSAGTAGGGGGGGPYLTTQPAVVPGGGGSADLVFDASNGAGSGGGGGGSCSSGTTDPTTLTNGGNGGNYGGGGGGSGGVRQLSNSTRTPGVGASGLIVINYEPAGMAASLSFQQARKQGSVGSTSGSLTFTAASAAGQERLVALCGIAKNAITTTAFTSVTIDGQAATQVGATIRAVDPVSNGSIVSFWRAPGTSATSVTVAFSVVSSGSVGFFDHRGALWTLNDAGTLLASSSDTGAYSASPNLGDANLDVNTAAGGAVAAIVLCYNSSGLAMSWAGLTERYDGGADTLYGLDWFSVADLNAGSASTPLTVTATLPTDFNSGSAFASLAVSFNPAAGGTTLTAATGSYALTGTAATFAYKQSAAAGGYALTGTAAPLARKQSAAAGSYALTGTAAAFQTAANVTLTAAAGAYALTGTAATTVPLSRLYEDGHSYFLIIDAPTRLTVSSAQSGIVQTSVFSTSRHATDTAGKFYFEVKVNSTIGNQVVGLGNNSVNGGNSPGAPTNTGSIGVYSDGTVAYAGSTVGSLAITFAAGDYFAVAYDALAELVWFSRVRSGTRSPWNGNGAANPGTGVGGIDASVLSPIVPNQVRAMLSLWDFNDNLTANFGATAFQSTTGLSGYTSWDEGVGTPFVLTAAAGSYALTGTAAALATSGNVTFTAAAGSYALTGTAATFRTPFKLPAAAGSYALTGTAATFAISSISVVTFFCGSGAYALSGSAATFLGAPPSPQPQPPSGVGNYAGGGGYGRGRMIRWPRHRRKDEDLPPPPLSPSRPNLPPPPRTPSPPDLQPPAPGLLAGMVLPPPTVLRSTPKPAVVDDDDEAIELILKLLS